MILRKCKKHGETKFSVSKGRHRCKKCSVEAVTKWRRRLKQKAIDYLGGECIKCGYKNCNAAMNFHHRNPKDKSFGIAAGGHSRARAKVQAELDKCDLLCANCHAEVHSENG